MLFNVALELITFDKDVKIIVWVSLPNAVTVGFIGKVTSCALFGGARPHCHNSYYCDNEKSYLFHQYIGRELLRLERQEREQRHLAMSPLSVVLEAEVNVLPVVVTHAAQAVVARLKLDDLELVFLGRNLCGSQDTQLGAECHEGADTLIIGEDARGELLLRVFALEVADLHLAVCFGEGDERH